MMENQTLSKELSEIPLKRKHLKILGGSGIGWALDAMDVGLISFVMAALISHWDLTNAQGSLLASVGFLAMALGATFGGLLADRYGRRQIFALTLIVYGLATGASALAGSLVVLLIFRFIVGLGLGAELPVASTYVSEFAPRAIRGRMVVILEAFWALGWILAALIGTFVVSASENGWRWAFVLGAIPAVYALYVRWQLPESVRFLESQGRTEEARAVVDAMHESPTVQWGKQRRGTATLEENSATPTAPAQPMDAAVAEAHRIWDAPLRKRTAALWTVWFCINLSYYGAFIWIPSLLHAQGFSLVRSFSFTLIITLAQLPGYAVAAYLIEKWGRRNTLATFLIGSAAAAACYGFANSPAQIIIAGCFLSFFNLGAWGALYAISPELYPTHLRATGSGAAAGFGRIASILAPLMVPPILAHSGQGALFIIFGAAFALAAFAATRLPEQRGKELA